MLLTAAFVLEGKRCFTGLQITVQGRCGHSAARTKLAQTLCAQVNGERLCLGADVLDTAANAMTRFVAPVTLLATGGAGQAYPITTNPAVATGDGCAAVPTVGFQGLGARTRCWRPVALGRRTPPRPTRRSRPATGAPQCLL